MHWRGRLGYSDAVSWMKKQREAMHANPAMPGSLLLCEHAPVITRGRHSLEKNLLRSSAELAQLKIERVETNRGGDFTFHGPGQLMIYPVLRVGFGALAFLKTMADDLIAVTELYGASGAYWRDDEPGVWIGKRKLAACGLHLSHGICIHGFSYNVATPPEFWQHIVPCGIGDSVPIALKECQPVNAAVPTTEELAKKLEPLLRKSLAAYGLDLGGKASLE